MRETVRYKLLFIIMPLLWLTNAEAATKHTIGWLENAYIDEAHLQLDAKIDTGADTSSLNVKILNKHTVNDEEWIRFSITDKHKHTAILERKIERYVKIKRKLASPVKRPVVRMGICIGNNLRIAEVNLAKREQFKYQLLIGRNYLKGLFLVDSELQYTGDPSCPGIKGD